MIDHPISIAIPSKIDWIGARHGLLMLKPSPDDGEWRLRGAEILTRGGRLISVGEQPRGGSNYAPYYGLLPRPILYMHPLAVRVDEDDSGMDRSGYCILYDERAVFAAYLRTWDGLYTEFAAALAYTPDSMGQAVAFQDKETVLAPLKLFERVRASGEKVNIPSPAGGHLIHSATPDGRFRIVISRFDGFKDFFRGVVPKLFAYSLSGERGSIVATLVDVAAQPYGEKSESYPRVVGERITTHGVRTPQAGSCSDPSNYDPAYQINRAPDWNRPDRAEENESVVCDIDFFSGGGRSEFLTLSFDREYWRTISDSADGSASVQWGGPCEWGGEILSSVVAVSATNNLYTTTENSDNYTVKLSGWGGENIATVHHSDRKDSLHVRQFVNGQLVDDSFTGEASSVTRLEFDGAEILTKNGWVIVRGIVSLSSPIYQAPESRQQAWQSPEKLVFRFTDSGGISAGQRYLEVRIMIMTFSAEGVYSLALCTTEGLIETRANGRNYLVEGTVEHRVILGRIFGFGISIPGRELTSEEINSRLFIAYDPLEKKFSDIYTHPIYFQ